MTSTRFAFAAGLLLAAAAFKSEAQQTSIVAVDATATTAFRDITGRRLTYICPPNLHAAGVWGTDTYKDDSSICSAAVHAGVLTRDRGGVVTIVTRAGQAQFGGSQRNGVESAEWLPISGSYTFVRDGAPGQLDWYTTASGLPNGFTQPVDLYCPANGRKPQGHTIWGNNVYADDSSICDAAVHAGLITLDRGGGVRLKPCGMRASFAGVTRNGITSAPYAEQFNSYTFAQLPCDSLDNRVAVTPLIRDSLDNLPTRTPINRDSLDNRVPRLPLVRDSLDNRTAPRVGSGVDSLDNLVALFGRISRTSITTVTSSGATRQLSLSLQDAAGALLTDAQRAILPVTWTTSNASCVAFASGSGTSPTATGGSVTTMSFGCPATVTAKIVKPAGSPSTAPAERSTTLQLR